MSSMLPPRGVLVAAADLDGDGLKDSATAGWWYRNPGTAGGAWQRREVGLPFRNMAIIHDFNGDGYPDLLGTMGAGAEANAEFVWAANDGRGKFQIHPAGTCRGDFLQGVAVARFRPEDVVSVVVSWHAGKLGNTGLHLLPVPSDPARQEWGCRELGDFSQQEALSVGDIDHDGRLDLLTGARWLRNTGTGWEPYTLHKTEEWPDRNRLVDMNRDGRLDAVVGYFARGEAKLAWYEQPEDPREPWKEHLIVPHPISWTVFLIIVMQQPRGQTASDEPAAGIGS
jgi:hypothetical protein